MVEADFYHAGPLLSLTDDQVRLVRAHKSLLRLLEKTSTGMLAVAYCYFLRLVSSAACVKVCRTCRGIMSDM